MSVIVQRLHGDYNVYKGQKVSKNTIIGYANGHGGGRTFPAHDHTSIGIGSYGTNSGWFNGCNKTADPRNYISTSKWNKYAHFVYNSGKDWGGYDYLQQTIYTWYSDCRNNTLHDGLDFYAPLGSKLYSGVNGIVTDVGKQKNGLTYCYIKISNKGDNVKTTNDYKGKARAKENLKMYYDTEFTTVDRVMNKGEEFYYQAFNGGWIISQRFGDKNYVRFMKHQAQDYFDFIKVNNK